MPSRPSEISSPNNDTILLSHHLQIQNRNVDHIRRISTLSDVDSNPTYNDPSIQSQNEYKSPRSPRALNEKPQSIQLSPK